MTILVGPIRGGVAIVPSDATVFPTTVAINVGVAGAVAVRFVNGTSVVLTLPAGIHRLAIDMVLSTGTTATGLVALY